MLPEGPGVKRNFTTLQPRAEATEDSTAVRIFALESESVPDRSYPFTHPTNFESRAPD